MGRAAAFFDLDKTIIAKSSTLAFGRPFFDNGLLNRRSVMKSTYAQLAFMVSGADAEQIERLRKHITAMCTGWDVAQVNEIVKETLHEIMDPLVYEEAAELIEAHRSEGRDVVIVSSSGIEVVGPIGEMVGADHVIATRMVAEDGKYTGEIDYYVYGPNKAAAILDLAAERGYDLTESYAYSDSVTDLPMLEVVGHPTAVNADRALRKVALERGWPLLMFTKPVTLRSRFGSGRAPAVTGAAIGIGAAVAGIAWYAAKRRDRPA
ncbi:MAG: HAD-IB family hydrolase [Actinomycetota bacterium]|nr:HAD-IB family hydrolase [Actinomycetota bacterium]